MHSLPADYISIFPESRLDKPSHWSGNNPVKGVASMIITCWGVTVGRQRLRGGSVSPPFREDESMGNDELTCRQEASRSQRIYCCPKVIWNVCVEYLLSPSFRQSNGKSKLRICLRSSTGKWLQCLQRIFVTSRGKEKTSAKWWIYLGSDRISCLAVKTKQNLSIQEGHRERSSPLRCCDEWTTHRRWRLEAPDSFLTPVPSSCRISFVRVHGKNNSGQVDQFYVFIHVKHFSGKLGLFIRCYRRRRITYYSA